MSFRQSSRKKELLMPKRRQRRSLPRQNCKVLFVPAWIAADILFA